MNATHFRMLVGLCSHRKHDALTVTPDDCDVILTRTEAGSNYGFIARIGDTLDESDIQALCEKILAVPSLKTRAIVAAEGSSEAAVQVATSRGVQVYQFRALPGTVSNDAIQWGPGKITVTVNPNDKNRTTYSTKINGSTPLLDADGQPHRHGILESLARDLRRRILRRVLGRLDVKWRHRRLRNEQFNVREGPLGDLPVPTTFEFPKPIHFEVDGVRRPIAQIRLSGSVQWVRSRVEAEYRCLVDATTREVYGRAAVAVHPLQPETMVAADLAADNTLAVDRVIELTEPHREILSQFQK